MVYADVWSAWRWLSNWYRSLFRPLSLGQRGERLAAKHLRRLGYKIVARGDRSRLGEIDLVAVDGRTVVFVEVKTRVSHEAGHPADAVDLRKQRKLTSLAQRYLQRHQLQHCSTRFDVIAITWADPLKTPILEHYRHAFEAVE